MSDRDLVNEAMRVLQLRRIHGHMMSSDVHWQAEECRIEANQRGKSGLYEQAVTKVNQSQSH